MSPAASTPPSVRRRRLTEQRGSLLIVAMVFAAAISIVLVSYLQLGSVALKLAHRSYFASDATNLAEAGLEEALYRFNQMGVGVAPATAWSGWTFSGTNAMYTLPAFNRAQNAVGIVKVYVIGYDGSSTAPTVYSQAVITPFDGSAPIVKTLKVSLKLNFGTYGLVALSGLTMNNTTFADSFDSNPTNSPTGPWVAYSSGIAHANAAVFVRSGSVTIATGKINGNLYLGAGVTAPAASKVTGTITSNYTLPFPMPVYPTAGSVSQSYNLGATIPATLPVAGNQPASDGCYYYFCSGATIGSTTITSGKNVVIVGTNTSMTYGLTVQNLATCVIYMDKTLVLASSRTINSTNWAGALQVFTTSTGSCTFASNCQFVGCLYAPSATVTATGTGTSNLLVGCFVAKTITTSNVMNFHYDEALQPASAWSLTKWLELQSAADRATVAGATNSFLR